jgi:copper transport protein
MARPRHAVAVVLVVAALVHAARGVLLAHAMLVSSEPAAESVVAESPTRVRLVFDEEIEPSLAGISLVGADGRVEKLRVAGDPHDVDALTAVVGRLANGAYRVVWRVVSADGHPVGGSFVFWVGAKSAPPPAAADDAHSLNAPFGPSVAGAPLVPALLRGLAVGSAMALAGFLLFLAWSGDASPSTGHASQWTHWLALAVPALLALHAAVWVATTAPDHRLTGDALRSAIGSGVGRLELWRLGLSLVALWALWLARRPTIALFLAAATVVISGATGHSAAISPAIATPAKSLHLLGVSAWIGGLLWLLGCRRDDIRDFTREASRVSTVALWASVAVAISGVGMAALFLSAPHDLVGTAYGLVLMAKMVGLLALIAFGAHHRFRALPALATTLSSARLTVTLRRELATMILIILLGGLLAYIPPARLARAPSPTAAPVE